MDDFLILEVMRGINRTREAVRYIKQLDVSTKDRKVSLAAWFRVHTRAAPSVDAKREAYDSLLGQAENKRLRG